MTRISPALFCLCLLAFLVPAATYAEAFDKSLPVENIGLKGVIRADSNTIRYYIHSKTGYPYDTKVVRADLRRLYKLGFFDDIVVDVTQKEKGLYLEYRFVEKPYVRDIIISGRKEIEKKKVLARVRVGKGSFFRQDQVPYDKRRIVQLYRNKGFYFTTVSAVVHKLSDNQVDVEYIIDEGGEITISSVGFRGKLTFATSELLNVIETSTAGVLSFMTDAGSYNKDVLKSDRLRLESFYHDHGNIKVFIGEPEVEVDREMNNVYITFPVEEGDRYYVGDITVHGDDIYTEEDIRTEIDLEKDDVFNQTTFRKDIFDITDLYARKGYAFANVLPSLSVNDELKKVDVDITTTIGRKVYIGRINIAGNETTRDNVIRREFRIQEGELFNSEKLRLSRQKINNLGFFGNIDLQQRSRRDDDMIDLDVTVEERDTGQISFAVGYSSVENLLLQGQVSWKNLFGRGQALSLSLNTSSRRNDFTVSFTEPALFDRRLSGGVDAFNRTFEFDAYKSSSTGGSFRVGKGIGDYLWSRIGYKYEQIEVRIMDTDRASTYLKEQEGRRTAGSIFPSLTYDTRNDPFNPTAGQKIYGRYELSGFGGEDRWYRSIFEYTVYQMMIEKFVGMFHAKIGGAQGYDGKSVPITKRFFLGGPRSLRGFTYRDIGPLDEFGEAIGGEALLQFNTELQYQFTRFFRGFLFYDRGNVYGTGDKKNNTTEDLYDLSKMRHSWGFGVHFFSPMGPITMAYGFKLDQRKGESPNEFHFTIGGAF